MRLAIVNLLTKEEKARQRQEAWLKMEKGAEIAFDKEKILSHKSELIRKLWRI